MREIAGALVIPLVIRRCRKCRSLANWEVIHRRGDGGSASHAWCGDCLPEKYRPANGGEGEG